MQIHQPSTNSSYLESIPVPVRTFRGHTEWVRALAVQPDGTLVSGSDDKTIKLWNRAGHCVRTLQGHTNDVNALAVLPDGTLVSGSWDKTIKLWDQKGRCVRTLEGHGGWFKFGHVAALAVLPEGTLASGSWDETIKLWDKNGRCVRTLDEHTGPVFALAVLPDGTLVSGSDDKTIKLWDKNGRCAHTLKGHTSEVYALAVLPDGTLVSGSDDKTIKLWDVDGRYVRTFEGHTDWVRALAVLPDGTLVSGSWDKTIKLWDKNGHCVRTLEGHFGPVSALAVLPDGTLVSSGSADKTIKLWEMQALRLGMPPAHIAPTPAAHSDSAFAAPLPIVAPASPLARPMPSLVSRVSRLLKDAQALTLSKGEREELDEIEIYHQHFYNAPLTEEARHELNLQVAPLNELIDRKTLAPAAVSSTPPSGGGSGGGATEEKRPSTPPAAKELGSHLVYSKDISIPFEQLQYQERLGEGSFGVVYRGIWGHHAEVAIKELKHKQLSVQGIQELRQEASTMAPLNHPKIVRLYGVCLKPGHYSLVMEYLPNVSLYHLLQNQQPLPWSVRHGIVMDITQGMTYLHGNQILHCDLKSLNVLLDDRLRAKIADFGLAKLKTETASTTKGAGGSRGSVPWMAPELFKRGGKNTKASDVYAYGMVLWEIASRKVPFVDAARIEVVIDWIKSGEKETIPEECPAELGTLITDCWKAAEQRPAMAEALARLQRWQVPREEVPVSALFASTRQRRELITQEAVVAADLDYASNQQSLGQ